MAYAAVASAATRAGIRFVMGASLHKERRLAGLRADLRGKVDSDPGECRSPTSVALGPWSGRFRPDAEREADALAHRPARLRHSVVVMLLRHVIHQQQTARFEVD